jgi:hypothetical protein
MNVIKYMSHGNVGVFSLTNNTRWHIITINIHLKKKLQPKILQSEKKGKKNNNTLRANNTCAHTPLRKKLNTMSDAAMCDWMLPPGLQ